jgi:hypothetical protein
MTNEYKQLACRKTYYDFRKNEFHYTVPVKIEILYIAPNCRTLVAFVFPSFIQVPVPYAVPVFCEGPKKPLLIMTYIISCYLFCGA